MTRTVPALVIAGLTACLVAPLAVSAVGGPDTSSNVRDAEAQGKDALERSALAYQKAKALTDVMSLEISVPNEPPQKIDIEYAFGNGTDSYVKLPGLMATAAGKNVYVTMDGADDKYVATPLTGDLSKTLSNLFGGDASLPVQFDMRAKGGMKTYLKSICMGMFDDGKISGFETIKDKTGRSLHQVTIGSPSGESRIDIDAKTNFVHQIDLEGTPQGAPPDFLIKLKAKFAPKVRASADGLIAFDSGKRVKVAGLEELQPAPPQMIAVGSTAPDFTLQTLDGKTVSLSDLKGSVVVLDFWATWCPPCRKGLPLLQEFYDWAKSSPERIAVYAVDTFEQTKDLESTKKKTGEFWLKNKFTMPTLLDIDDSVAAAYGVSSIPVTVVIGPDGKVTSAHLGFDANMVQTLKEDVAKALPSGG